MVTIVKILNKKNLQQAVDMATVGRFKFKHGALKFVPHAAANIALLKDDVGRYMYRSMPYTMFYITDTKTRLIHAPCFRDKLLQYAVSLVLSKELNKRFINDSYACIKNKGPQKALLKLKYYQNKAYCNYKYPKLVKIDISKFFYTINRSVVFNILGKYVKCEDTRILLAEKLKFYVSAKGLPLGNLTSQIFANMILNEFDHFVKRHLRVKYYVRYADDMFMIVNGKKEAERIKKESIIYLHEKLDLSVNPKKCYIRPANDIVGLGFRLLRNNKTGFQALTPLSQTRNKLYKLLKTKLIIDKSLMSHMRRAWIRGKTKLKRKATLEDIIIRMNSWYGHVKLGRVKKFIEKVFKRNNVKDIIFTGEKFIKA